jgi:hypothetical protein
MEYDRRCFEKDACGGTEVSSTYAKCKGKVVTVLD